MLNKGEVGGRRGARSGGRLFRTCRKAGRTVCDGREINGKEKGVAVIYVFIQNVKEMQANKMT